MTKKFVFKSNKYNITHQDIQRNIEDRGYIDISPQRSNEINPLDKWGRYMAQRSDTNIFPSSSVSLTRIQIHDAINRLYNSLNSQVTNINAEQEQNYVVGYNFNKQKICNYVEEYLLQNPDKILQFFEDSNQFIVTIPGISIKNILIYNGDNNTNRTLPFLKVSGGIITGHHKDERYERGLQGPFAEHNVGGYKHRHQKIGTITDRPERYKIIDSNRSITIYSPLSSSTGLNYNIPYSRFSRDGFTKSAINSKNIKITDANTLGNFSKNYQIINGLDRKNQNLSLIDRPAEFSSINVDNPYVSGVVEHKIPDRRTLDGTYNKTAFVAKFGAPGDINSISLPYLDKETEEYSPYNTINYRNSSPRYYLKKFLSTPTYFGGYKSGSFNVSASYHKVQKNNRKNVISGTSNFKLREDNTYISFGIPSLDNGYLWISNYAKSGNNPGLYINGVDNDILFITSSINGLSFSPIGGNYYTITDNNLLTLDSGVNEVLRKYNIQYNGLWNFSTKKQLSQNYNKIINNNKKINLFTDYVSDPANPRKTKQYIGFKDSFIKDKHTNTTNVYENEEGDLEEISYPFGQIYCSIASDFYRSQYNQIINLYNDEKNIKTSSKKNSLFIKLLRRDKYIKENNLREKKIKHIKHEEKIFPKSQNVYRNFARIRNSYSQRWADSLDNRLTELTNSQGKVYSAISFNKDSFNPLNYSYWPLDANTYYDSITPASRDKSGELLQLDNPALYTTAIGSTYTIVVPSSSYYGARFGRNWNTNRPANVVHEQAGRGPYFNSYETFYSDIRLIGQDCSLIPEYRISPRLDEFYASTGSLYDDHYNKLELTGTILESTTFSITTSSVFMEERSHTDYIDLNSYFNQTIPEYKLDTIKIKVKAIKKLLPYDEFYPQKRMIKLAQQFSSSYSSVFSLNGAQSTFRTALAPIYAPGIGFNSIKAGVGMPYSIATRTNSLAYSNITSSVGSASFYYQKLPWDTILYPYKNLQNVFRQMICDIDPDIKINSTASIQTGVNYNNTYDYIANNFYAEIINFFKDSGELTTINSKEDSQWYFPDLTKKYCLDLVINKQGNFYTYSSLENFGPKPYAFHCPPWYNVSASNATSSAYNSDISARPNDFASAGESYVRITFDPASLFVGDLTYAVQGKFNIGDIIRNSTVEYYSSMLGGTTSSASVQLSDIVDIFSVSADGKIWQPKLYWECPTADLNFYNLSAKLTNSSGNDSGAGVAGNAIRGIWHQYAPISNTTDGLFLSVRDPNVDTTLTGSLLSVVGFDKRERKKVGKIASSREINEAIVIVPFYLDNCENEKYFDIDIETFEKMYERNIGVIGEIKALSRKYVLPPTIDFIRHREISNKKLEKSDYKLVKSPFLMFPVEFSSLLTEQDLADIWQGVMPKISTIAEVEYKEKEFFIGNYLKDLNFKLPDNTRFKIFKVKRRAIINYNQVIDQTKGNNYIDLSYGYNWPYDFFSLIEMGEVKAELTYGYDINPDQEITRENNLNLRIVGESIPKNTKPTNNIITLVQQQNSELTPEQQLAARLSGQ